MQMLDLFYATGLFLYHQKSSENQKFSNIFRGYKKKPVAWNRLIVWKLTLGGSLPLSLGFVSLIIYQSYRSPIKNSSVTSFLKAVA